MKVKLKKFTPEQLLQAALGELTIDATEEVEMAVAQDEEARTLGILTKSVEVIDSRVDAALAEIKTVLEGLKAIPKPDDSVLEAVNQLRVEFTELKETVTGLAEKAQKAVDIAESIRADAQRPDPIVTGAVTPDMTMLIQQTADVAQKANQEFAFDSFQGV